jgi:hypothetical protein
MSLFRDLEQLSNLVVDAANEGTFAEASMVIDWRGHELVITVGLETPIEVIPGGESLELNWKAGN